MIVDQLSPLESFSHEHSKEGTPVLGPTLEPTIFPIFTHPSDSTVQSETRSALNPSYFPTLDPTFSFQHFSKLVQRESTHCSETHMECCRLASVYGVVPGFTWGSLPCHPEDMREWWLQNNCDTLVGHKHLLYCHCDGTRNSKSSDIAQNLIHPSKAPTLDLAIGLDAFQSHGFQSFATQDFVFEDPVNGTWPADDCCGPEAVAYTQITYRGEVYRPQSGKLGDMWVETVLFQERGRILVNDGLEKFDVVPGVMKWTVGIENWDWCVDQCCNGNPNNCDATKSAIGEFLKLQIDVKFSDDSEALDSRRVLQSDTLPPSNLPTVDPTFNPTREPSNNPTSNPSAQPTGSPTVNPTLNPTLGPTRNPTFSPSVNPTRNPTFSPSMNPTRNPSFSPTIFPTYNPTLHPTQSPVEPLFNFGNDTSMVISNYVQIGENLDIVALPDFFYEENANLHSFSFVFPKSDKIIYDPLMSVEPMIIETTYPPTLQPTDSPTGTTATSTDSSTSTTTTASTATHRLETTVTITGITDCASALPYLRQAFAHSLNIDVDKVTVTGCDSSLRRALQETVFTVQIEGTEQEVNGANSAISDATTFTAALQTEITNIVSDSGDENHPLAAADVTDVSAPLTGSIDTDTDSANDDSDSDTLLIAAIVAIVLILMLFALYYFLQRYNADEKNVASFSSQDKDIDNTKMVTGTSVVAKDARLETASKASMTSDLELGVSPDQRVQGEKDAKE